MKYTEQEMDKMREVRICTILGIADNGRNQVISCPHGNSDRTPSCYIYADNSYHCFSCDKNGQNAIDFLLGLEGVEFKDVLSELNRYI